MVKEKIILVTGSTDGIGKLTALVLARQNAEVIIHGRNKDKVSEVVRELSIESRNNKIEGITFDLSSLEEVRKMADYVRTHFSGLNILINNAGVGYSDPRYSKDGYELRFAVNYLAPFLLTQLLLPLLIRNSPSRIVNVSSAGQYKVNFDDVMLERNFNSATAYSQSKLALIMYTFELAEMLKDKNVTVNALHPGTYLNTKMVRNAGITPWGKPESGAEAVVNLAVSEKLNGSTGKYYSGTTESQPDGQAYDRAARKKLWQLSLELTNLKEEV